MTERSGQILLLLASSLLFLGCFKRGVTPIQTHFNKGVYQYARGDHEAAIGEFRMALEEDAGDRQARFNLAEALESRASALEREAQAALKLHFGRSFSGLGPGAADRVGLADVGRGNADF